MIIFDTYTWIEYFIDSEKGKIVEQYLNSNEKILTPSIVLVELSCKSSREKWNFEEHLNFIKSKSAIVKLDDEIIIECGKNYIKERIKKPNFSLPDAIILTTSIKFNARILTGDKHFNDIKNAVML